MSQRGASPRRGAWWSALATAVLFAVRAWPYLRQVYAAPLPGGGDLVVHFAAADLYARNVFPAISGWMPEYFAGFPFPDFYPPGLYWLVGLVRFTGVGAAPAFYGVLTVFAALVPILVCCCACRLTGRPAAGLWAGAIAVGSMVGASPESALGITLTATFDLGHCSQLVAFVFLLLFYCCLLRANVSRAACVGAALSLALVPLCNVHVVWNAILLFVPTALVEIGAAPREARARVAVRLVAVGAVAVLVAAAWWLPMMARLRYVPTLALDPEPRGAIARDFYHVAIYVLGACLAALAARDRRALALGCSALATIAIAVVPIPHAIADVALQTARILAGATFLGAIAIGGLAERVAALAPWRRARFVVGAALVGVFWLQTGPRATAQARITPEVARAYQAMLDGLRAQPSGRVLAELGHDRAEAFGMQALIGAAGFPSLTTAFRESSLDVLFAAPLRNSLSGQQEAFAVDSKLPPSRLRAPARLGAADLRRLHAFRVRYFVVQSETSKALLRASPEAVAVTPPGPWQLFALRDDPGPAAEVPAFEPVLTFARFSVKRRDASALDFVRLNEELFLAGHLDPPLVLAGALDEAWDDRPRVALITRYDYRDAAAALAQVERFTRDRTLVAVAAHDPLFDRIAALAATRPGRIHLVGPSGDAVADCARIAEQLDAVRVPLADAPQVVAASIDARGVRITLDRAPARPTPVRIIQSYHPSWRVVDGAAGDVFLATPAFQLVFADAQIVNVARRTAWPERLGWALTVVGLLGIVALAGRRPGTSSIAPSSPVPRPTLAIAFALLAFATWNGLEGHARIARWLAPLGYRVLR